jgi:fructosamine-3-kinase
VNEATRTALWELLGAPVVSVQPLAGGDINEAYAVELSDGRPLFVKVNASAPPLLFESEARGLHWLREAGALRVPEVLAVSPRTADAPSFLVLELLEPGRRVHDFDERLGRGLAQLHRFGAPHFGLDRDNFIASLPQPNGSAPTWAEFYRERRLLPLFERARHQGLTDSRIDRAMDRVLRRLDELSGPPEPPARLHGDLWGGNLHVDGQGQPTLIDPAVYGGHREIDLAMMQLFGGFGPTVFEAYEDVYPSSPGRRERLSLYQLYPLLVHLNLFGAGYAARVRQCLEVYA